MYKVSIGIYLSWLCLHTGYGHRPSLVLRSAGLAAEIGLFVNQGNSFRLSLGVFTIPPTHGYRRPVVELWNTLAHA